MTAFAVAHAEGSAAAELVASCAGQLAEAGVAAALGFVYATDALSEDFPAIVDALRKATSIPHWVGTTGIGIVAGEREYHDRPALAVLAAALPEDGFHVFPTIRDSADKLAAREMSWIRRVQPPFGVVHADPANARTPDLVGELARAIGASFAGESQGGFLVGGLTSSRGASRQVAERVTSGGISGVLFAPEVEVATGLSQGCRPIGPSHVITDCLDNVLITLDGRPALEVLREDAGDLIAGDLRRAAGYVHAALPVAGSDTGDYLVRNLIGFDPGRGWLAIGDTASAGHRLMFVRRDPESAKQDLRQMVRSLRRRVGERARGGLYFSCVARGPHMFGAEGNEIALVREELGPLPLAGFYAGGEISNDRLYGYTGVLTLFL